MTDYKEFIAETMANYATLNHTIRKQASQMEILKTKNNELEKMVVFLKDRLIEFDPTMRGQLEFLNF